MTIHQAILDHMVRNALFCSFSISISSHTSVQSYIQSSRMHVCGMWGSEMLTLAHMLQTDIHSYNTENHKWHKYESGASTSNG